MKKIFTLITAGALMVGASFAQRTVDFSVDEVIVTPSTITHQQEFSVTSVLKNNGPDSLKKGDTVYYQYRTHTVIFPMVQGQPGFYRIILQKDINANDTFSHSFKSTLNITGTFNSEVCAFGTAVNRSADSLKADTISGNNLKCVPTTFTGPGVGINSISLTEFTSSVFPNPARDKATISFTYGSTGTLGINIYDISGKLVKSLEHEITQVGEQSIDIKVDDMENGVYFYSMQINGEASNSKLIINR